MRYDNVSALFSRRSLLRPRRARNAGIDGPTTSSSRARIFAAMRAVKISLESAETRSSWTCSLRVSNPQSAKTAACLSVSISEVSFFAIAFTARGAGFVFREPRWLRKTKSGTRPATALSCRKFGERDSMTSSRKLSSSSAVSGDSISRTFDEVSSSRVAASPESSAARTGQTTSASSLETLSSSVSGSGARR